MQMQFGWILRLAIASTFAPTLALADMDCIPVGGLMLGNYRLETSAGDRGNLCPEDMSIVSIWYIDKSHSAQADGVTVDNKGFVPLGMSYDWSGDPGDYESPFAGNIPIAKPDAKSQYSMGVHMEGRCENGALVTEVQQKTSKNGVPGLFSKSTWNIEKMGLKYLAPDAVQFFFTAASDDSPRYHMLNCRYKLVR
jgi:hypothetical protein